MSIGVKVRNNNLEKALRIFKRKIKNSGILEEYKDNRYFIKKSVVKRTQKKLAMNREKYRDS